MFSIIPPPATENRVLCQTIIYILMARQSVRLSKTRKLSLNLLTVHQVSNPELSKEKAVMLPITNQSMTVFSMHFVLSLVSCTIGTGSFPGVKSGRGVTLTPYPLLVPWSRKSRAIPLLPLWAVRPVQSLSACTRVHFTFLYPLPTSSTVVKKE